MPISGSASRANSGRASSKGQSMPRAKHSNVNAKSRNLQKSKSHLPGTPSEITKVALRERKSAKAEKRRQKMKKPSRKPRSEKGEKGNKNLQHAKTAKPSSKFHHKETSAPPNRHGFGTSHTAKSPTSSPAVTLLPQNISDPASCGGNGVPLFSPSTASKRELARLGGLRPVLKLLESRKSTLAQTASLVLSNCTAEDPRVCHALLGLGLDHGPGANKHIGLVPLVEHLTDSDATVALHVCKTLANCTSACSPPGQNAIPKPGDYTDPVQLSSALRQLGGLRLLVGSLSPQPEKIAITGASLLALGNLCCDDPKLCHEMRAWGAFESLILLLRPCCPLMLRDRAASTLLNCLEGTHCLADSQGTINDGADPDASSSPSSSSLLSSSATEFAAVSAEAELVKLGAVSSLTRSIETLVDGRDISQPGSLGDRTRLVDARDESLHKAAGPMIQSMLDVLWYCCSDSKDREISRIGTACNELFECGGVHLMMLLLGDHRVGVQQRACRVLALACSSSCEKSDDIRRLVWSKNGGAITKLVWLVKHQKKGTAKAARRCLDGLRNRKRAINTSSKSASSSSDDEVLLPLIEQGIVPIFHGMSKDAEKLLDSERKIQQVDVGAGDSESSKPKRSASCKLVLAAGRFATDYLSWLEFAIRGQDGSGAGATFRVLLRTLCMQGNEELRGHVATALVILCFKVKLMRQAFIRDGALDATLSMLKQGTGRGYALDFLYTLETMINSSVEKIAKEEDESGANLTNPYAAAAASGMDPPPAELLSERHINNPSSSNVTLKLRIDPEEGMGIEGLRAGVPKQTLWTFHAHRSVLQASSEYFRDLFASEDSDKSDFDITVASFEGFEALVRFAYTADESQLWRTVEEQGWSMQASASMSDRSKNKNRGILDGKLRAQAFMRTMVQAHRLGMGGIKRLCAKRACSRHGLLCEDTVMLMFASAMQCDEIRLARTCYLWAVENWMPVLRAWDPLVVDRNTEKLVGLIRKFIVKTLDGERR